MILRPYQSEAIASTFAAWETASSVLGVAATGLGKAQPLTAKVITPAGPIPMGDIRIGQVISIPSGGVAKVSGVFPQGEMQVFRVVFSDQSSTLCSGNHLWNVQTKSRKSRGGGFEVRNTLSLVNDLVDGSGAAKWFIPMTSPVFFAPSELPIHPYVLGVLIGDGGLKYGITLSSDDQFIINRVMDLCPYTKMKRVGQYDYILSDKSNRGCSGNVLRVNLKHLGLFGLGSAEKFIPETYLLSSVEDRIQLLRGLMDTDGHVRPIDSHAEFSTVSERLANDVCFLVRSLGGATRVRNKKPGSYTHNGEMKTGLPSYRVTVTLNGINPFELPRKANRAKLSKVQGQTRSITSIEPIGEQLCQCISVDHPSQLYLTDDFIVTHNTVIFASIIAQYPGRVMVVAHREELVFQAANKINQVTGLEPDIEMAELMSCESLSMGKSRVVVSTIQTQTAGATGGRMQRFNPHEFDLLVIDEAHHGTADTYRRVIDYYRQNERLKVLGVTATPDRADEEALGQIFEQVAFEFDLRYGIEQGWLVPVEQAMVHVAGLDLSKVRTTAGDLNGADLAAALEFENGLHKIASPTIDLTSSGQPTLIFADTVDHAERLSEILNRHRADCARWVCGKTPKPERRKLFADFAEHRYQYLVNVGVLTEGFDEPSVAVVVMANPTKSRAKYAQMIGRGTRPLPGIVDGPQSAFARQAAIADSEKKNTLVVDFVGNSGRHRLISSADILGGNYSDEVVDRARELTAKEPQKNTMKALEEAEEELIAERAKARTAEAARRAQLIASATYSTTEVDPFDAFGIIAERVTGWDSHKPIPPKMLALLERQGVPVDGITFKHACQLTKEITSRWKDGRCTLKQAQILAQRGIPTDISRTEAKAVIDGIAIKEGWGKRKPRQAVAVPPPPTMTRY